MRRSCLLSSTRNGRTGLGLNDRGIGGQAPAAALVPEGKGPRGIIWSDHARRRQSQRRIMVEHANAEVKQWRSLQRWTGERDDLAEVIAAIGALVSDRSAKRPTRSRPNVELDLVRATAC